MEILKFEQKIKKELKEVMNKIIAKNINPNISAKARAGAEISSLLEKEFVKETKNHKFFIKTFASPEGSTKNPWDAQTYFHIKQHEELIWIDFKAIKISSKDSNPDIGTPDKFIKLVKNGFFYIVYIIVFYKKTKKGLRFVTNNNNEFVDVWFLKDINSSFRRNPKNQLQVNVKAIPEMRNRRDFIELLFKKIIESHKRQIQISKKALKEIEKEKLKEKLLAINTRQETKIRKI